MNNQPIKMNVALGIVKDNLRKNKGFGSSHHFMVSQLSSEMLEEFKIEYGELPVQVELDYDKVYKLAFKLVERISQ